MGKKIVLILIAIIGLVILEGCGISQRNIQANETTTINQPVTKTQTDNPEDKPKVQSDSEIKTIKDNRIVNNKSSQEINKFTNEELRIFELIKKYYPDFTYSDSYTNTGENNKEMIFEKQGNLYFNAFISYLIFKKTPGMISDVLIW